MLEKVLGWLQANPLAVTFVVWPIVTAIVNLAFKDASAYADRHPRLAAAKKLLQKYGCSPRGTIALIAALFVKNKLPPPPPGSGDVAVLVAAATVMPGDKTDPGVPPIHERHPVKLQTLLFAAVGCIPFFLILVGCGSAQTHANIEKAAYTADDGVCVTEATDKDGGIQCLNKYERLYAPFWPDSGMTVCEVSVSDAGTDGGK